MNCNCTRTNIRTTHNLNKVLPFNFRLFANANQNDFVQKKTTRQIVLYYPENVTTGSWVIFLPNENYKNIFYNLYVDCPSNYEDLDMYFVGAYYDSSGNIYGKRILNLHPGLNQININLENYARLVFCTTSVGTYTLTI